MNISAPFIKRPIATTLLSIGVMLAGILAFYKLPVSSLPEVEFPTIVVQASLPGASPEIMATSVTTPLERCLSRISGITDMTSGSSLGSTRIIIQFDLSRDIDGAASDVQAAINAAASYLPSNLPANPSYRKANPSDSPILILGLTSDKYSLPELYDQASTILQQKFAQVEGVGQIITGGGALPAIRIEINPDKLNQYGISLSSISSFLSQNNLNMAKGIIEDNDHSYHVYTNDQALSVEEYKSMIIKVNNGSIIRFEDIATVNSAMQDIHVNGLLDGQKAVAIVLFKQPGSNVIETVNHVLSRLDKIKYGLPKGMNLEVVIDRTLGIKESLRGVETTLVISIILVIFVVYLFLASARAMIIPGVALVLSLLATFAIMWLLGFSLNSFTLLALTISTGFVIDDAIVVLENISRYIEKGLKPKEAALKGAEEIGFTVTSISISLIAVFIPILCMGGIVGRLFREFAVTLSVSILVSLILSITLTPTMCAYILNSKIREEESAFQRFFSMLKDKYDKSLYLVLSWPRLMLAITILTIALTIFLYMIVPKGFFPQQDTGRIVSTIVSDQSSSYIALNRNFREVIAIINKDPAVDHVIGFIGGNSVTNGSVYILLKDINQRIISSDQVIARLRNKLKHIAGLTLYMQSAQDIQIGGRQTSAQFQYTISTDSLEEVNKFAPEILQKLKTIPSIVDVNNDQRDKGMQAYVKINYDQAASLGVTTDVIDKALYAAFGQSQVSTMFEPMNQYYVVLFIGAINDMSPQSLKKIYVPSNNGNLIPLSSVASFVDKNNLLSVNHQGLYPSATISFNLIPGAALGDAVAIANKSIDELNLPNSLQRSFKGTAQAFSSSLEAEPLLILAAILSIYIVLGMLYESLSSPLIIISTIPSAGVGALIALLISKTDLSIIAMMGIILLIGIVKKNAIMMVDFIQSVEKDANKNEKYNIHLAATLRFRPIMMTTMAALLGAVPLAFATGMGSEMQRPLGISIIGGLLISQILTLYTTPSIYLAVQSLKERMKNLN